jgi:hypothetical protein
VTSVLSVKEQDELIHSEILILKMFKKEAAIKQCWGLDFKA